MSDELKPIVAVTARPRSPLVIIAIVAAATTVLVFLAVVIAGIGADSY